MAVFDLLRERMLGKRGGKRPGRRFQGGKQKLFLWENVWEERILQEPHNQKSPLREEMVSVAEDSVPFAAFGEGHTGSESRPLAKAPCTGRRLVLCPSL